MMCLLIMRECFFISRDIVAEILYPRGLVKGVAQAPAIAEDDMNVMFATNVTGLINMTQTVMQIYKKRKDGGAGDIIMIGSIAGREPYAGGSIYCATKAAVRSFTDALRRELIATRIRVIEIDPGQVETVCLTLCCSEITLTCHRNFPSLGFMVTRRKPTLFMRKCSTLPQMIQAD